MVHPLSVESPVGVVKLACKNVWKLFGQHPERFLADHGYRPNFQQIREAGYIGATRDVSLEIYEGEIFVIMGLSGSGKSTLVRNMSRLIEPTAGEILFDGMDLLKADEKTLIRIRRKKMGMVFQSFGLLPHRNVLDNVAFPLEVQGIARFVREERAEEMIELVGLKGREEYFPRELSGGEQQRVGIARSLAVEPEVWFLDEPFSALDPLIRAEMQDEFLRLQKVLHKTIVFITHDFDEAIRLADRIAIMKDGEIIQVGTPEELVLRPANSYVSEFTHKVPRAKVLSAHSVMTPLDRPSNAHPSMAPVTGDTKIEALICRFLEQKAPIPVVDGMDRIVGEITVEKALRVLIGEEAAANVCQ